MSDVLLIDNSILQETVLVPVTAVQPDLVTQTDVVVYVPLASKNAHGIVKIGNGLNITNDGELWWDASEAPIKYIAKNGEDIVPDDNKRVNIVLNKTDVGLSNVDNTSDLDKPISNATQQAINIVKNDVDNLSNSIDTIEINITDVDNKQNLDVITDISITGTGDNRYITSTTKNIKTQVVSTDNDQLTLASDTHAGLMSVSDYQQLRTNTSKIEQLENKTSRLIYDDKSNPTASDINNFAVGEGYEPPFAGLSVVVADTYHIWHYYANVGWKDDGLDIVQQFTNTTAGVIMGSELDGKIYAETDGTASVNGWGALKGLVSSIDINVTNHINNTQNPHNVTKTQVGLSNVDNTSDIDKPISTAVQSALDLMLPRSEAPTKVSDLKNDAAYIKNNDVHGTVQIPYIYNVQRIYSVEDKDQLVGNPDGKTEIDLSSDSVSIDRRYPNTPTYIRAFASERDGVRDITSIQSASTKRLIVNGAEDPTFPSNSGVLRVVSEDDGSYIEANLSKLTVVQDEAGSNTLHQDSKSLIFNWSGLYLNNNEISPNTIRYDIEQTLTDEQKAKARANIGAGTGGGTGGGGTVVTVGGVSQETWDADAKLDKSFIKTFGDTKITVDMNSDNTAGIVASYENSGTITEYIVSTMNLEFKEILQYISGVKADGTPVYNAIMIDENDIEIGVTTDAVGGSGIVLTPDKIEIETPKLTYNGNEVATVNQLSSTSVESVNGKTGAVVLYSNDVGAVAIDDIVDNLITESTTKVLSANQGKVLADRDAETNQQLTLAKAEITVIQGDVSTLQNSVSKNTEDITQNMADIADINKKIPTQASETNKLADKDFVNSSINNVAAFYITADANGNAFETYAQLSTATVFYSGGQVRTPTRNDYCVVRSDENHDNATTRYIYQGSQWEFQYIVNETSLTAEQLAAINSGITSALVTKLNGIETGANKITVVQSTGTSTSSVMSQNATTTELAKKFNSGYGTCSTASATSAKVVTIADTNWQLKVGTIIGVKFTNTNSASNVTLNVNNTGAKSIYYSDIVYTGNNENIVGYSGKIIYYMYDGTYWCWLNSGIEKDTLTSAYCNTTSATASKVASCTNYKLLAKSYLHITMTNANTSKTALTLNVNNTGEKPIYINGKVSSATNYTLPAGSYIVYYDGTNYQFRTDGVLPNIDTYPAIKFAESERQKSKNLFPNGTVSGKEFYQQHLNTPIKAGTYTVSALVSSNDTDSNLSSIIFEDADKTYPVTVTLSRNSRSSATFTIGEDCYYVTFFASNSYVNSVNDAFNFSNIQIEEGSVATDYQPYNGAIVHEKEIGITIGDAYLNNNVVTAGEVSWVKQGKLVVVSFSDLKFKSPINHQTLYFFGLPKKAIKSQTFLLHQINANGGSSLRCMMFRDSTQIVNWYQDTELDTNAQYYGQFTYITDEN